MKTRCPGCQTTFKVTPEQLKARAGKVRCGQCQAVFNALDSLLEETSPTVATSVAQPPQTQTVEIRTDPETRNIKTSTITEVDILLEPSAQALNEAHLPIPPAEPSAIPISPAAAQEMGKAAGLILPRDTREIPGYSKWAEGVVNTSFSLPESKTSNSPFILASVLFALALFGQIAFHYRSSIAVAAPALRPALEILSEALGSSIPLMRQVDLVSIESSDLQFDTVRNKLFVLHATLRNRASYGQAYPALELTLTDTQDNAIARRVFMPDEYLPQKSQTDPVFAANADLSVRLWIEASEINAAGYRLYVFYP